MEMLRSSLTSGQKHNTVQALNMPPKGVRYVLSVCSYICVCISVSLFPRVYTLEYEGK